MVEGSDTMKFVMTEKGFSTSTVFGELQISGTDGNGFRPIQLFISSLAGCSGVIMRTILNKKRIPFTDIQIETEVERTSQGRITSVHLHFLVTGQQLDTITMEKVLKLTRRNCQMVQSVQAGIEITESISLVEGQVHE